jgi:beta-lactamase superfamily II metal-dependent hydrolase
MSIGVHILGPGYGESIVLELPDGRLGVIDCFLDPSGRPAVIAFLRERFGAESLAFLAITHPHADHCAGAREILEAFDIEELWIFDAVHSEDLRVFHKRLAALRLREPVEEDLDLRPGTVRKALQALRRALRERLKEVPRRKDRLLWSGRRPFPIRGTEIQVRCLTPGDRATLKYREGLAAGLEHAFPEIFRDRPAAARAWFEPNLASAALSFEYRRTRLLFLADAESPLWEEWIKECREDPGHRVGGVQLIKVGHHGSGNGHCRPLYEAACAPGTPLAVITPFTRHRFPLPSPEGTEALLGHDLELICTNRMAARRSSGLEWGVPAGPAVPRSWLVAIRANPRLASLLAPPYGGRPTDPGDLSVPIPWLDDCRRDPRLRALLKPGVGGIGAAGHVPTSVDEHLVSFYFNDAGEEEGPRRYLGPATGVLDLARGASRNS